MCKINGRKLGELRANAGISRGELGKEIGLSQSTIKNYESGVTEPSNETLEKICVFLNVNRREVEVHDVGYDFLAQEGKKTSVIRKKKGFVRYMTPIQTEKWIEEKRDFDDVKETKEIKMALSNSFGIGKKKYILIDPKMIHIPLWQRDTDFAKATEIADGFSEDKFDPVKVYVSKEGKLNVADGAHRVIGLVLNGEFKILAEVLDCDEHEAVLTFLGQSIGRKAMSIADTYRAGIEANVEEYINFKYFFERHNIQITSEYEKLDNPLGVIRPSSTILRMVKNEHDVLESVVMLIKNLEWCGSPKNAYTIRNINVLKKMYSVFGEETEQKLFERCKGATYYESKVVPVKSDAELFDILSSEINK